MNTASADATGVASSVVKASRPSSIFFQDQILQTRFIDRDFAAPQRFDLCAFLVHANDAMAEVGKTGA
jgi:hypothetical protein